MQSDWNFYPSNWDILSRIGIVLVCGIGLAFCALLAVCLSRRRRRNKNAKQKKKKENEISTLQFESLTVS